MIGYDSLTLMKQRYFGYIRVSTPKQGQGVSLPEQREAILAHAKRRGLTVVEWFEEKETAAKEGRGIFSAMLAQLEQGQAQGVIIHKIDRSARNLWDWANLGKLFDRGIDVQFAHDGIDLHSRGGRLSADIMAVVAADYVRNLKDEVKKGFYGRLKQGFYPLPAPTGYIDNGGGKIKTIDPVSGPLLKWAFERYARGDISMANLAIELHEQGLRPRRGRKMSAQTLAESLRNPFYIGIMRIQRTKETFQGLHQPLVSTSIFDRVQDVMDGRGPRKALAHPFAFRRFVRCAACARHLIGERKKGKYVYYRCYTPGCEGAALREAQICAFLMEKAERVRLKPEELKDLKDFAAKDLAKGAQQSGGPNHIQMQLAKCEERLLRLTDALIDQLVDKESFEARKLALLKERCDLRDRLANPRTNLSPEERVLAYLELPNIQQASHKFAGPEEWREIGEAITWNFSALAKEPAITLKSPYREIEIWRLSGQVDRVVVPLELSCLYHALKRAASNDNNPLASPSSLDVPRGDSGRGTHGLGAAA